MGIVKIEIPRLDELKRAITSFGPNFMPRVRHGFEIFLNRVADSARTKCPVSQGRLQSSITYQITKASATEIEGLVGTNVTYAPYVELGTGLYGPYHTLIRPRTAKVLAWKDSSGRMVFAKYVRGMKARPYLLPALNENVNKLVDDIKSNLGKVQE